MKPNVSSFKVYETFQDDDNTRNLFQGNKFSDLRELFRHGDLIENWYKKYPMLFDNYDRNNALNQAGNDTCKAHFHEWLSAILIYHSNKLLSLNQNYAYKGHIRKRQILEKLTGGKGKAWDYITSLGQGNITQPPDLLVYSADYKEWFFVDAKGPNDKLRQKQEVRFQEVQLKTRKPVFIVKILY